MSGDRRKLWDGVTGWGVDLWIHRVAISEHYRASPAAVRAWPFRDVFEAHVMLDAIEELREIEADEARRNAGK